MINRNTLLLEAIKSAYNAGKEIMDIYNHYDFNVEYKADESPLTLADKKSNDIIANHLEQLYIPLLSEEGKDIPYEERKDWDIFWLIDPLDGTKEFIKRNGEFTVNIALIEKTKPVLGVIYAPVLDDLYYAEELLGSKKISHFSALAKMEEERINIMPDMGIDLPLDNGAKRPFTIVGSRSHMSEENKQYYEKLKEEHDNINIISKGSSLKICMVAEGSADEYPRFGPTMEWDTAAGHAIATYANCSVFVKGSNDPLTYNKEKLLNPHFIIKRNNKF